MAKPPRPSKGIRLLYYIVTAPVWVLLIVIQVLCRFILIVPFCMISPSANWGLYSTKDIDPVRVYLQHFRNLHPDLINYYSTSMHQITADKMVDTIRFWPSKSTRTLGTILPVCCGGGHITTYQFTYEAAFFASLEAAEYSREKLWQFLRDDVERHVALPESMKVEYRRVMGIMNRCKLTSFLHFFDVIISWITDWPKKGVYTMPEQAPPGMHVIGVNKDDIDWIVSPGALLVPLSVGAEDQLRMLELWRLLGSIDSDSALEKGISGQRWATIDLR